MTQKPPFFFRLFASFITKGEVSITIGANDSKKQSWDIKGKEDGPKIAFRLTSYADFRQIVLNPDLAIAEAYMRGRLVLLDTSLDDLLVFLLENKRNFAKTKYARLCGVIRTMSSYLGGMIARRAAKRNVKHHYDLSDALYRLFLDERRQYSCAYFRSDDDSLTTAQIQKIARIAAKLRLQPHASVLDIGCGWGELAYALSHLEDGVTTTGITLSENQYDYAKSHCELRPPLRASFFLRDYRDEVQRYDHIVSVGMLEHVGRAAYPTYFQVISNCLHEDGTALIHTIGKKGQATFTSRFITKYIFPGGYIPNLAELASAISQADLHITDIECLHNHYAQTLRHWRMRCEDNKEQIIKLYDEPFYRMWLFYLVSCEYYFRLDEGVVYQIQLRKRRLKTPSTRDYIAEKEQRYVTKLWQQTNLSGTQKRSQI